MLPKNREPMHPGRLLAKVLQDENMTQDVAAKKLGVSLGTINTLVNERRGMTAELAVRLGKAFEASPQMWMGMQANYDLWRAERALDSHAG